MSTILTAPSWDSGPSRYVEYPAWRLVNILTDKKTKHWTEVLPAGKPTKAYFDIDVQLPNHTKTQSLEVLEEAEHILNMLGVSDIISVCNSDGKDKISYHIVADYYADRTVWRDIAKRANLMCKGSRNLFDTRVYGRTQKFRLAYTTKPASGIINGDPEQRVKVPVRGSVIDSFVSDIPEGTPKWADPNPAISAPASPVPITPIPTPPHPLSVNTPALVFATPDYIPPCIKWFEAVLQHSPFRPLWTRKADDYESFVAIGSSIYFECHRNPELLLYGQKLFQKFSEFTSKFLADQFWVAGKFTTFTSTTQSKFNAIKQWVTKFNRSESNLFNNIYQGKATTASSFVDTAMEFDEETANPNQFVGDFLPVFSFHRRIYDHLITYQEFWRTQLQTGEHLKRLLTLLRYMDADERFWYNNPTPDQIKAGAHVGIMWNRLTSVEQNHANVALPYDRFIADITRAEKEFLQHVAVEFGFTGYQIPDAWFTDSEDPVAISSAFITYSDKLKDIDRISYHDLERRRHGLIRYPLKAFETGISSYDRIVWCMRNVEDRLWYTQVPYDNFMLDLLKVMRKFKETNGDISDEASRMIISHRIAELRAEVDFGYFANSFCESEAARVIFSLYPFWYTSIDGALWIYDDLSGMYSHNPTDQFRIISRFEPFLVKRGKTERVFLGGARRSKEMILKEITSLDRSRPDPNHAKRLLASGKQKLLFPNGYYDGISDKFYPSFHVPGLFENTNTRLFVWPDIQFFASINDPFLEDITPELEATQAEMYERLFVDMHGHEVAEFYVEAKALAMFREDAKYFVVSVGPTDSGKSCEIKMDTAAQGGYHGTSNLNKFKFQEKSVKDASRELDFVYHNWFRHTLAFSEVSDCLLNADLFKMVASAGDNITCRAEGVQDVKVTPLFTMFIYVNSPLRFNREDAALWNRLCYVIWEKQCVEASKFTDPKTQIIKNDEINMWRQSPIRRQLYIRILIEAHRQYTQRGSHLPKPAKLLDNAMTRTADINGQEVFESLMMLYEFTGMPTDFIPVADFTKSIRETCNQTDVAYRTKQITTIMEKYPSIFKCQKKIANKNTFAWVGIRPRASLMEQDMLLTDYDQWVRLMDRFGSINDHTSGLIAEAKRLASLGRILSDHEVEIVSQYGTAEQCSFLLN